MNVDTSEFRNLAAQVAEMAEQVRRIAERDFVERHFFAAGRAAGEEAAREALMGKAARTSGAARPARTAGPRPDHLRAVKL